MTHEIAGIGSGQIPISQKILHTSADVQKTEGNFGDIFSEMVKKIEASNQEADQAVKGLMTGEATDLHSVMLAVHKADLSLRVALEVRDKLVDAYQQIMRTNI